MNQDESQPTEAMPNNEATAAPCASVCSSAFLVKGSPIESRRKVKKTLGKFAKRQQARQWCRNHRFAFEGMTIVHPDGTQEAFDWGKV